MRFGLARIGLDRGRKTHRSRNVSAVHQDVGTLLPVRFDDDIHAGESHVQAEVQLSRLLPADVVVGITRRRYAGTRITEVLAKDLRAIARLIQVHVREIEEPIARLTDLVVADQAVGRTQFQVGDDPFPAAEELFVGNDPTATDRREESPPLVAGETLRTVVAEIELQQVTGVVVVGETSRKAEIA